MAAIRHGVSLVERTSDQQARDMSPSWMLGRNLSMMRRFLATLSVVAVACAFGVRAADPISPIPFKKPVDNSKSKTDLDLTPEQIATAAEGSFPQAGTDQAPVRGIPAVLAAPGPSPGQQPQPTGPRKGRGPQESHRPGQRAGRGQQVHHPDAHPQEQRYLQGLGQAPGPDGQEYRAPQRPPRPDRAAPQGRSRRPAAPGSHEHRTPDRTAERDHCQAGACADPDRAGPQGRRPAEEGPAKG